MADNYLEKKYESLQQGRPVYRKTVPSLDSLLRACAAGGISEPSSYKVKMAQLQAMVRSASELDLDICGECSETDLGPGVITLSFQGDLHSGSIETGEYLLAMKLKAAELGLKCRLSDKLEPEKEKTPSVLRIEVFR